MSSPLGDSLGEASIKVNADTDGLTEEIKTGTKAAAERAEDSSEFEEAGKGLGKKIGEDAGKSFVDEFGNRVVKDGAGRFHNAETGEFVKSARVLGQKAGDEAGDGMADSLKKKVDGFGALLAPAWLKTIAVWAGVIGPPALELADTLLPAVGVVAAIIPVALGAAASMFVLKSAFGGVSDAIKAMNGPAAVFNADLKKLAPNARAFVLQLKQLSPMIKDLQKGLQNTFFGNLNVNIAQLGKNVLPKISDSLYNISSALGVAAGNFLALFNNGRNIRSLNTIFNVFADAIYDAANGIGPLVTGLLTLGKDAAPLLDIAANKFAKFAFWFQNVITNADKTGKLQQFFVSTENALGLIFQLGKNVYTIVSSLLSAAGKSGGGGGVLDLIGIIATTLSTLNKNGSLTEVFKIINNFFAIIGKLIALALPPLSKFILAFGEDFSKDLSQLTPTLVHLVNYGLIPLVNAFTEALPYIQPVVSAIISLLNALTSHATVVQVLLGVFIAWFAAVKVIALAELITGWKKAFLDLIPTLAEIDVWLDANPIGALAIAIAAVIAGVSLLVVYLYKLNESTDFIGKIGDALKTAALATWDFLKFIGTTIGDFFTKTIPGWWNSFVGQVLKAYNSVLGFGKEVASAVKLAFSQIVDYASSKWDSFVKFLNDIPTKISVLGSKMEAAGLHLISSFFHGLANGADKVGDVAKSIANSLKDLLNRVISKINSGINKVGHFFPGGLPNIPMLASGAFVTSPTLALIGERHPEVVLPTDDPRRAAQLLRQSGLAASLNMQTPTVNVTVKIGETELTDIVDTQIAAANEDTALALAHGPRN